jgi:hypothetical protein
MFGFLALIFVFLAKKKKELKVMIWGTCPKRKVVLTKGDIPRYIQFSNSKGNKY